MADIYVDAFSGASGDMLLGAILDGGLPEAALREVLARVPVDGYELAVRREKRKGILGTRAEVRLTPHEHAHDHAGEHGHGADHGHGHEEGHSHAADHAHDHSHAPAPETGQGGHAHEHHHGRNLADIEGIIDDSALPGRAAGWAKAVFRRLAEAEAKVHGTGVQEVHFHEVGAVDSIVDILGVCAGLALLGMERLRSSPLPMGSGYVTAAHGRLPVPAPAVVELMRGVPTRACDERGELTTPTGAAILVTLAESFGPMPPMTTQAAGYGAGARQGEQVPNLVRLVVGKFADDPAAGDSDSAWLLEANIDDATGETLGAATKALLAAGALDVWLVPVTMKKGRPGVVLSCLAADGQVPVLEGVIFRETTTFGIRRQPVIRSKLAREHVEVHTAYGTVRVKVGRRGGEVLTALPEYEDCLHLAEQVGVAFRTVYDAARAAWTEAHGAAGAEGA